MFKTIQSFLLISSLALFSSVAAAKSVQGRHGSYEVQQFGSATVQIKAFGWRNAFSLKAYATTPASHGGSVDRALEILAQDQMPYMSLKIDSGIRAFAKYPLMARSVRKNRSKLSSPKGEVDALIAALEAKGNTRINLIEVYYEASSATFFINLDGDLASIESSSAYFSKLLAFFNDTRAKFRIVNLQ